MRTPWLRPILLLVALLARFRRAGRRFPARLPRAARGRPGTYDVLWKVPAQGEMRLARRGRSFRPDARIGDAAAGRFEGGAYVERWQIERAGGLAGQAISHRRHRSAASPT